MKTIIITGKVSLFALTETGLLPRVSLIEADALRTLNAPEAVLIAGEDAMLPAELNVLAAVVNADSGFDVRRLSGTPVITCGMGGKNTVSVTSRTAEQMTLSLNRSVRTLRGVCEPLELPLPLCAGAEDFSYMAAFAAAVLLGYIADG